MIPQNWYDKIKIDVESEKVAREKELDDILKKKLDEFGIPEKQSTINGKLVTFSIVTGCKNAYVNPPGYGECSNGCKHENEYHLFMGVEVMHNNKKRCIGSVVTSKNHIVFMIENYPILPKDTQINNQTHNAKSKWW